MLTGHSEFYLTLPAIYFGVQGQTNEDESESDPQIEFQFDPTCPFISRHGVQPTGMFIDWYDLPN